MKAQELLKQRFEVIADYPNSDFKIGDILQAYFFQTSKSGMYTYVTNLEEPLKGKSLKKELVEEMPHLFKKLNWWEHRKLEDMPKKVMSLADDQKSTYKIEEWDMIFLVGWIDKKNHSCCSLLSFNPQYGYIPVD